VAYIFLVALILIMVGELADKSQLLALLLATRYKAWQVLAGIFAAALVQLERARRRRGTTPGLRLDAVVTSDAGRGEQARADHPGARVLGDAALVWSDPGAYDLVVVATGNAAHVPQATLALEQGLPVVVDKPLAADLAAAPSLNSSRRTVTATRVISTRPGRHSRISGRSGAWMPPNAWQSNRWHRLPP